MEAGSIAQQQDAQRELRAHLHGMWAAVAPGWDEHADYVDARSARLTKRMIELADLRPGDRALELACGPGGLGIAAAECVAPGGDVVLSDVVPEMTEAAARRAAALRLNNVSARNRDLEQIEEPDQSFDVVLCREGLMFAADPARAAREIHRVLRPGGRVAIAVWGPRAENPWLGLVLDAVGEQLGTPVPPPGIPGPFSLQDADELAKLLSDAGFAEVTIGEEAVSLRAGSFEEWWTRTRALAGPLAKILESLPGDAVEAIRTRLREATASYETPDGIELPGLTLVATGRA